MLRFKLIDLYLTVKSFIRNLFFQTVLKIFQMKIQISFLRDAPVPVEVVRAAPVLQQGREVSRVIQDRYLVAPEAITVVLGDSVLHREVREVLLVGAALEGGGVPEYPERVFSGSGIDDEGV